MKLDAPLTALHLDSIREPLPNRIRRLMQLSLRLPQELDAAFGEDVARATDLLAQANGILRLLSEKASAL